MNIYPNDTEMLIHSPSGMTFALTKVSETTIGRKDPVTGIYPDIDLDARGLAAFGRAAAGQDLPAWRKVLRGTGNRRHDLHLPERNATGDRRARRNACGRQAAFRHFGTSISDIKNVYNESQDVRVLSFVGPASRING